MVQNVTFEEISKEERMLLLKAFDYDIDAKGYILNEIGERMPSPENPGTFLHIDCFAMVPGSLKLIDGTPTAISKEMREKLESSHDARP